jgi:hypothetical protein
MPIDSPDAGPSTVISAPAMSGASGNKMDPNVEMHKLMSIVSGPEHQEDSMNSREPDGEGDEEKMKEDSDSVYDNSPDEKLMGDPMEQFGDINSGDHRQRQAGLPIAKPMETTFKQLLADYEQFIAEGATMQAKGPKEVDVPAVLRKQKRPGQANAQASVDAKNAKAGANVWSSKRTSEGAVKQAAQDLKDMSEAEFKKKYGKTKAEARTAMTAKKEKPSKDMSEHFYYKSGKSKDVLGNRPEGGVAKYGDEYKGMITSKKIAAKKEKTGKELTPHQKMSSKSYGLSGPKGKLPETKK